LAELDRYKVALCWSQFNVEQELNLNAQNGYVLCKVIALHPDSTGTQTYLVVMEHQPTYLEKKGTADATS